MGLDMDFYKTNKYLTNSEMLSLVDNYCDNNDSEFNDVFTEIGYFRKQYDVMGLCFEYGVKLDDDIAIRLTKENISNVIIDVTKNMLNDTISRIHDFEMIFETLCYIRDNMGEFDLLLINSY